MITGKDEETRLDPDGDGVLWLDKCDDHNSAVNAEMHEICNDGLDNDCDGTVSTRVDGGLCQLSGTSDLSNATAKLVSEESTDIAGYSVSSVGDVNGDGIDDILVGARGNDAGGSGAGAAYFLLGVGL